MTETSGGGFWLSPTADRVVVMQEKVVRQRSTLLQVTSERPTEGTVLAVGPDVKHLKAGDYVIFAKYSGQEAPGTSRQGDGVPIILREYEVIAKMDKAMLEAIDAEQARQEAEVQRRAEESLAAERARLLAGG